MKFTLYTADCSGNPKNKAYPHEMIVTSAADLKKAVRFDHVCARYAGNVRSEANFEMSDVLVLDCRRSSPMLHTLSYTAAVT